MSYCVVKTPQHGQKLGYGGCERRAKDPNNDHNKICTESSTGQCTMKPTIKALSGQERADKIKALRSRKDSLKSIIQFKQAVIAHLQNKNKKGLMCTVNAPGDKCSFKERKAFPSDAERCFVQRGTCKTKQGFTKLIQFDIPTSSTQKEKTRHKKWITDNLIHPRSMQDESLKASSVRIGGQIKNVPLSKIFAEIKNWNHYDSDSDAMYEFLQQFV